MVDVIGFENLARAASGGEPAQQDDYGRLWRLGPLLDDEEYVAVEVVNSTPEPDGSFRHYFLRVPRHEDGACRRRMVVRAERPRLRPGGAELMVPG